MLLFDGPRQHDDLAGAARRQREPSLRRAHAGQRPQHRAKPPDFDAITLERLAPAGERIARATGAVAIGAGLFLIARAAGLG